MTDKNKEIVGIGEVVKRCQVSEKQLRYWQETEYIEPENVVCGDRTYRRYREKRRDFGSCIHGNVPHLCVSPP